METIKNKKILQEAVIEILKFFLGKGCFFHFSDYITFRNSYFHLIYKQLTLEKRIVDNLIIVANIKSSQLEIIDYRSFINEKIFIVGRCGLYYEF